LAHVGERGAIDPATGMETFTSPRLADLNVDLPVLNDLINQYRAEYLLRITGARDAEINAANAELAAGAINNAARNARVQEANEFARIRQSNLEYDEYQNFLSRAEKVREDRAKEIRVVRERHAKICESIREWLGPVPRNALTAEFASGCAVRVYERLHLNYIDNSQGNLSQTVMGYLMSCSFNPYEETLDHFIANFDNHLGLFIRSGNLITDDVQRTYLSDALARGSNLFADDIREAERRHPVLPTLAEFKAMVWRTYHKKQNLDLFIAYANNRVHHNDDDFGGNTSSNNTGNHREDRPRHDCPHCKKSGVLHSPDRCYANKNGTNYRPNKIASSSLGKRKSNDNANTTRVRAPGNYQRTETVAAPSGQPSKKQRKQEIVRYEDDDSDGDN